MNITWLANANYADSEMTWSAANVWAASLNPYGSGITGWRLPTTIDSDGPDADALGNDGCSYTNFHQGIDCGYNITTHSEMSHLFYVTLGDKAYVTTTGAYQPGYGLSNTGPLSNLPSDFYWSATSAGTNGAWLFDFVYGSQSIDATYITYMAWAVHDGDVSVANPSSVPVPPAAWLFGSGLLVLMGATKRKQAT